jgi:hydrogenase maturation protein HypF
VSREAPTAIRLTLTGRVQGLGVRPAIARWAQELSLTGWVGNTSQGVEGIACGTVDALERFVRELPRKLPVAAVCDDLNCAAAPYEEFRSFEIRREPVSGALQARVPHDLAACGECLDEALNDVGRRRDYPFVSCTACGPRFSIIEGMPYERDRTTMRRFTLCPECAREYGTPADRRFHAETNACPACGPQWWCRDRSGRSVATGVESLRIAAQTILRGEIVAIKGLGGYQLVVDATSEAAVNRLRNAKQRFAKPLAVMAGSVHEAQRLTRIGDAEIKLLQSAAGPIVVLPQNAAGGIARSVSPGLDTLGLMLPTTPLHALLLRACGRPLVVTSGNREGEPLEFEADGAHARLAEIADLWLEHDRDIHRPVDDSVVRMMAGRVAVLRLARGFAPLPLEMNSPLSILAVGGHQKAACALSNGVQAALGPHVGDLDSVAERVRWETQIAGLTDLYGCSATLLAGDLHPDYAPTRWAAEQSRPVRAVQHHHAHVVAGMIEHGWLDRTVLGVAFDGTGLGDDGTIWGGEFLRATVAGFQRVGHLLPFDLPGGERAIREPWRTAVALVRRAAGTERAAALSFQAGRAESLLPLFDNARISPTTTSAGRLFDGIAALVLGVELARFEGAGPMLLEAAGNRTCSGSYGMRIYGEKPFVLDWRPAVVELLDELRSGVPPAVVAMRFHRGLAQGVFDAARRFPEAPIVLSGGCFQNRLLVELLVDLFEATGRPLGTPGLIPVNDGGLAAGQLAVAAALCANRRKASSCV